MDLRECHIVSLGDGDYTMSWMQSLLACVFSGDRWTSIPLVVLTDFIITLNGDGIASGRIYGMKGAQRPEIAFI